MPNLFDAPVVPPAPAAPVHPVEGKDERPDPKWVRGRCPDCGEDLVSNLYYIEGKGYLCVWECWSYRREDSECTYRRVL